MFSVGGGGQRAPSGGGGRPVVHTETAVSPEPITLVEQMSVLNMRNR